MRPRHILCFAVLLLASGCIDETSKAPPPPPRLVRAMTISADSHSSANDTVRRIEPAILSAEAAVRAAQASLEQAVPLETRYRQLMANG